MKTQELNRDVKRLLKRAIDLENNHSNEEYYATEPEMKKEISRLLWADEEFTELNRKSILILIRLNLRYHAIPLHQFGLHIDLMNLFYNKKEYNKVTNYEKDKFYFMINKRMAIAFPEFAALLSQSKISTNGVVDFWQFLMSKKNKSTPDWLTIKVIEKGINIFLKRLNKNSAAF